jgi:uncharacterized LabA/DUF88 family protein
VKEGLVAEERLKIAVFVDFDNIQIGVKDTLGKEFDVSIVLEALKERGEVVSKIAYGDWPRAGDYSREMTQHAVHMVQRSVTPRGDKNGADINLALDALEMAFTHNHINTYVIVGGDSDFIALVEKLKQYDKRVFVVGGRQFTSGILQRNCHEFISYENLLRSEADNARAARAPRPGGRTAEARALSSAMPNIQRALEILAEREVAPQLGLLKSTLLQLDATFSERDFGAGSFLEFIQKLRKAGLVEMRRTDRGYLVETVEADGTRETAPELPPEGAPPEPDLVAAESPAGEAPAPTAPTVAPEATTPAPPPPQPATPDAILAVLRQALPGQFEKAPNRPLYLRQIRQLLRAAGVVIDERTGFRGLLDVLHQAQREGWLRLHRDRKGVWRTFPAAAPVPVPAAPPEMGAEAVTEAPPEVPAELEPEFEPEFPISVETDVNWEPEELLEQIVEPGPPTPPEEAAQPEPVEPPAPTPPVVEEEVVLVEPPAQPKARKRASKPGARTATRKAAPRRKSKSGKVAEPGA